MERDFVKRYVTKDGKQRITFYQDEDAINPRYWTDRPLHCEDYNRDYSIMSKDEREYKKLSCSNRLRILIGLYGHRDAIIGILKAKAIYVPLDLAHPEKRMMDIINDCQIKYVIYHSDSHPLAGKIECVTVEEMLRQPTFEGELPSPSPDDFAHLLYTSGTTGKPKGVPIKHWQNVLNAEIAVHRVFHAEPGAAIQ